MENSYQKLQRTKQYSHEDRLYDQESKWYQADHLSYHHRRKHPSHFASHYIFLQNQPNNICVIPLYKKKKEKEREGEKNITNTS